MPRNYDAIDYIEPVDDTMVEQFGNSTNYNVVNGCAPSFSASDMTVTVGAGQVTHNGSKISVAEDTVTLVSDNTNPVWAFVGIDSTGAAQVVHGTAAANPTVPELGDYVEIAKVLIEPGQTIANACAYKMDKRVFGQRLVRVVSGEGATTVFLTSDVTALASTSFVSELAINVSANTKYTFKALLIYLSAIPYYFGFVGPDGSKFGSLITLTGPSATPQQLSGGGDSDTGLIASYGYGESTPGMVVMQGSLVTGSNAGQLRFRHRSADAILKAKSQVELL